MGKSWDEFTQSLSGLQNLGVKGIWDAFINGSTEAAESLKSDKKLIDEFITATKAGKEQSDIDKIKEQMTSQARPYVNQMDEATLSSDNFAASQTRLAVSAAEPVAITGSHCLMYLLRSRVTWSLNDMTVMRQMVLAMNTRLSLLWITKRAIRGTPATGRKATAWALPWHKK